MTDETTTLYLQDRQVGERYGVSRTTLWRWCKSDPSFPKPVALSPGCSRWRIDDLEKWEQAKSAQSNQPSQENQNGR